MAFKTFYIDFDSGTDAPLRGQELAPYLTLQYAVDDIVLNHGLTTPGTLLLCIGTSTNTANIDLSSISTATYTLVIRSDGATSFGTHSYQNNVRATIDLSSNSGVFIAANTIDYVSLVGFKWTGFTSDVWPVDLDNYCSFIGNVCDFTGIASPRFIRADAYCQYVGNDIRNAVCSVASGALVSISSTTCLFWRNRTELDATNTNVRGFVGGTAANYISNLFILEGDAIGISAVTDANRIIGNDFYGSAIDNQQAIIGGGSARESISCFSNHFENLDDCVLWDASDIDVFGGNTYHNVTNPPSITGNGGTCIQISDVELDASGFIDAAGNDFRATLERLEHAFPLGMGLADFPLRGTGLAGSGPGGTNARNMRGRSWR